MTSDAVARIDAEALGKRLAELGARVSMAASADGASFCVVEVGAEGSLATLTALRDEDATSMRRLVDLTVIDRLGQDTAGVGDASARFLVVYELHSPTTRQRLRVEVAVPDPADAESEGAAPAVDTAARLWPAADWLEREAFDLFGIHFRGHPDLRRLLLDDDFEGAPMRRDHPRKKDRGLPAGRPEEGA